MMTVTSPQRFTEEPLIERVSELNATVREMNVHVTKIEKDISDLENKMDYLMFKSNKLEGAGWGVDYMVRFLFLALGAAAAWIVKFSVH